MHNESSQHAIPHPTQRFDLQPQQEVYHLTWGYNQILVNGLPLRQQFSDLCRPILLTKNDMLPELGTIEEFEDPQECDEVQPDIPALIEGLESHCNSEHNETSSHGNVGTLHAEFQQNYGYPYCEPMNPNFISFNVYENFNFSQLQHAFCDATAVPATEGGQEIDSNILNTPLSCPSLVQQPSVTASALPEAAPTRQPGAFSSFFKHISVHSNNQYPESNSLEIDKSPIFPLYEEPDIKDVVFPGPFSPLNRFINNNPVKPTVTHETDAPSNNFFKFNSSLEELWEENSDLGEMFQQAKRVSLATARGTSDPRRRGRPVSRPPAYSTISPSDSAQSRNRARGRRSRKKVTVTTPGPVTRSQTRRLRTA